MAARCACAASAPTPRSGEMGLMTGLNGARADRMPGWGRETRTTESVRTEIRLSCARIFARFGQTEVQRRFQCELRVRESAAAAGSWQIMSTGRTELNHVLRIH